MLTIRLQRTGSRNNPDFRIVLAEKHRAADKKVLEVFGEYNPRTKFFHLRDEAKLKDWLNKHTELSPTVHNLLVDKKILVEAKVKAWRPKVKKAEDAPKAGPPPPAEKPAEAVKETVKEAAKPAEPAAAA